MLRLFSLTAGLILAASINLSTAFAYDIDDYILEASRPPVQQGRPCQIQEDSALVAALSSHKGQYYVEAGNLTVTKILPDDTQGLKHQKWDARLSNGATVQIVYNSDMGARVPVQVGNQFSVGGQFIATGKSGLVHWTHEDPRHKRPDGYVCLNNVVYGISRH